MFELAGRDSHHAPSDFAGLWDVAAPAGEGVLKRLKGLLDAVQKLPELVSKGQEALRRAEEEDLPQEERQGLLRKAVRLQSEALELMKRLRAGENEGVEECAIYALRGWAYLMLNNHENAVADLARLVELDSSARAHGLLGAALAEAGDLDAAIQEFDEAIRLDDHFAEAFLCRGFAHRKKEELDAAHWNIVAALALKPELYREEFEPIMEAERESEERWDELLRRPESQELLEQWGNEAREAHKAGKTKPLGVD